MSKNYLMIDGRKVDLSDETVNELKSKLGVDDLPKSWEELAATGRDSFCYFNGPGFPTMKEAKASGALEKLCLLRDAYNGEPFAEWCDWEDKGRRKYILYFVSKEIETDHSYDVSEPLAFKTEELRDKFLENFKDLIEQARPLL